MNGDDNPPPLVKRKSLAARLLMMPNEDTSSYAVTSQTSLAPGSFRARQGQGVAASGGQGGKSSLCLLRLLMVVYCI